MNELVASAMLVAAGGLGTGRALPTVAAAMGLFGVVIAALAVARSAGRTSTGAGRRGAIAATVLSLISLVIGGLHAANSAGGFGTGNGLAGAIVAIALGLIGTALGGLALARSRQTASGLESVTRSGKSER